MIKYSHIRGTKIATLYVLVPGHGFRTAVRQPLASLRPEVAATLQMKARLHGRHASVYLDAEGNIIDTPEVLP